MGVSNDNYPVRERREAKLEEYGERTLSVSRRTKVVEENFVSKIREGLFRRLCHSHSRGVVSEASLSFFGTTLDMAPDGFRERRQMARTEDRASRVCGGGHGRFTGPKKTRGGLIAGE